MRLIFTKRWIAIRDRAIESPDAGFSARSYTLDANRRVVLWAGVNARIQPKTRVDSAKLRLTVVSRNGMPGKISIARLRRQVSFDEATWLSASAEDDFQAGGGLEGPDITTLRQVSFVPTSNEYLVEVDVLEDLQAWVMRGESNFGWMLTGSTQIAGSTAVRFGTCPTLDLGYSGERTSGASVLAGAYDVLGG